MRKFFSIIGLIVATVVLVIIGIVGSVTLEKINEQIINPSIVATYLAIGFVVGGFGGAVATGCMAIANFFKIKTKQVD